LPRSGRRPDITEAACTWLIGEACVKAKERGYPHELWTLRLLAVHAREHGSAAGHTCLAELVPSTLLTRDQALPCQQDGPVRAGVDPDPRVVAQLYRNEAGDMIAAWRQGGQQHSDSAQPAIAHARATMSAAEMPQIAAAQPASFGWPSLRSDKQDSNVSQPAHKRPRKPRSCNPSSISACARPNINAVSVFGTTANQSALASSGRSSRGAGQDEARVTFDMLADAGDRDDGVLHGGAAKRDHHRDLRRDLIPGHVAPANRIERPNNMREIICGRLTDDAPGL
jgi:hypothetical protein